MPQAMHSIGNKFKKLRELRNFTQSHMAEQLGISQSSYSTIENGEQDITLSRLEEISKLLGMRVEDVITFDEKMVFNISNSKNGVGYVHQNTVSNDEKWEELYREMSALRERVGYLEGIIEGIKVR
ncbi:MAG TPA: XRE family transcriptional regulator [Runella sp.]|nr:XRE family transcriptional regulator [Runella sp.]